MFQHHRGPIAVAHNGNLVDAALVRSDLESEGAIFQSGSDTEVIPHLMARSRATDVLDALVEALRAVRGAYALLFLVPDRLIAVRDPWGFRPLSLGRLDGAWVIASETCAFDLIGAEHIRDLDWGEILVVDVAGTHSFKPFPPERPAPCAFEHVYFARPDSHLFGQPVQKVRLRLVPAFVAAFVARLSPLRTAFFAFVTRVAMGAPQVVVGRKIRRDVGTRASR